MIKENPLVVLIAGPSRSFTYWDTQPLIREAEVMMQRLYKHGFIPICPQAQHQNMHKLLLEQKVDYAVMQIMRRCDAIIVLAGWQNDPSTVALLDLAHELMIPKFFTFKNLLDWYEKEKEKKE